MKGVEASAATALVDLDGRGSAIFRRVLAEERVLHPFRDPLSQVPQQLVLDGLMCMYPSCIDGVSIMHRKALNVSIVYHGVQYRVCVELVQGIATYCSLRIRTYPCKYRYVLLCIRTYRMYSIAVQMRVGVPKGCPL